MKRIGYILLKHATSLSKYENGNKDKNKEERCLNLNAIYGVYTQAFLNAMEKYIFFFWL